MQKCGKPTTAIGSLAKTRKTAAGAIPTKT